MRAWRSSQRRQRPRERVDWGACARSAFTTRAAASSSRSSRATPGRVGIYACGPTVYGRIHVGNARPFVVFSLLKRFLAHEGYAVTFVANVTDVNDKIYDAAARAQPPVPSAQLAAEMTAAYMADTDRLGLGRPDHEPLAGETMGPIVELIEALIDNGSAYAVDGDVYFRVRSDPRYGELSHRGDRRHGPGRGHRGHGAQGGSARLRALEGAEARRGHRLGRALGPRAPRLAHRVLGDGRGAARRRVRHPRRRQRPRLPPPRERGGADAHGRAARSSRGSGCTTGCSSCPARRWPRASATSRSLAEVLDSWGRDALVLFFSTGHYRQPIRFSDEALDAGAGAASGASARPAGAWCPARRRRTWRRCASASSRARRRLQHPARAGRAVRLGRRGQPARGRSATRDCARCSACSGSRTCSTPRGGRPGRRGAGAAGRARGRARRARLRRGRPPARRARRARLGGPRRRGRPRARAAVILYGRNAVHEALRARRRRVHEVWATEGAAREPWLAGRTRRRCASSSAQEIAERAGSDDHQGVCADADGYHYAGAAELLARRRAADRRARRGPGSRRTSARSAARPSAPARPAS